MGNLPASAVSRRFSVRTTNRRKTFTTITLSTAMQSNPNRRAVIVGVFVLLGLIFLFGGILAIGNLRSTFSSTFLLNTVFQDVNGLQAGNNVWFSGVKIGTVRKMNL